MSAPVKPFLGLVAAFVGGIAVTVAFVGRSEKAPEPDAAPKPAKVAALETRPRPSGTPSEAGAAAPSARTGGSILSNKARRRLPAGDLYRRLCSIWIRSPSTRRPPRYRRLSSLDQSRPSIPSRPRFLRRLDHRRPSSKRSRRQQVAQSWPPSRSTGFRRRSRQTIWQPARHRLPGSRQGSATSLRPHVSPRTTTPRTRRAPQSPGRSAVSMFRAEATVIRPNSPTDGAMSNCPAVPIAIRRISRSRTGGRPPPVSPVASCVGLWNVEAP